MDEFDDFYAYGDDSTHDMMADYDYYINTGELCDCFEEEEKLKKKISAGGFYCLRFEFVFQSLSSCVYRQ